MSAQRSKGKPKTKTKGPSETRVSLDADSFGTTTRLEEPAAQFAGICSLMGCCDPHSSGPSARQVIQADRDKNPTPGSEPHISIQMVDVQAEVGGPKVGGIALGNATDAEAQLRLVPSSGQEEEELDDRLGEVPAGRSLDDVKANFVTLISYNRLQYFLLGTLIYTVMIIVTAMKFILFNYDHLKQEYEPPPTTTTATTTTALPVETIYRAPLAPPVGHNYTHQNPPELFFNLMGLLPPVRPLQLVSLLLGIYLFLMISLVIILTLLSLEFNNKEREPAKARNRLKVLPLIGLIMGLSLMGLQIIVNSVIYFGCYDKLKLDYNKNATPNKTISEIDLLTDGSRPADDCGHILAKQVGEQTPLAPLWLPLDAVIVMIYLIPVLCEEHKLRLRHLVLAMSVFVTGLVNFWLLQQSRTESQNHFTGTKEGTILAGTTLLLVALLLGLQLSRNLVKSVTQSAFAGASQLVEAKVSLEHQRQQQETLLLSVLPAYVAEQVKRNMLKKTTSAASASGSIQDLNGALGAIPAIVVPPTCATAPEIHLTSVANSWKSRSFTALHGSFQSTDSTNAQMTSPPPPPQATCNSSSAIETGHLPVRQHSSLTVAGRDRPRSSFQLPGKALTSGLSAITESLVFSGAGGGDSRRRAGSGSGQQLQTQGSLQSGHSQLLVHQPSISVSLGPGQVRRGFNELYIRTYNNVSLLYGDIVGFTRLCTQLSSSQLVRVLNDLFSQFDHLAERHRIMRIKILGDCYYGVSGIPEFAVMGAKSRASRNDNHAINCVNMGLDMIHYIRCLNVERASQAGSKQQQQQATSAATPAGQCSPMPPFELNMRIGIHTGHIHSGVIGLKKWQFDVWSNDVSIAMHCESSGIAGRVQVTQATVQQLNGAFTYENAYGPKRDSFLADKDIQTYLIKDRVQRNEHLSSGNHLDHRPASSASMSSTEQLMEGSKSSVKARGKSPAAAAAGETSGMDESNIRAATIGTIREILLAGETYNANEWNSYGLALDHHDIRPVTLSFRDQRLRRLYANRLPRGPIREIFTDLMLAVLIYLIGLQEPNHLPVWGLGLIVTIVVVAFVLTLVGLGRVCLNNCYQDIQEPSNESQDPLNQLEPHLVIRDPNLTTEKRKFYLRCCGDVKAVAGRLSFWLKMETNWLVSKLTTRRRFGVFATILLTVSVVGVQVNQVAEINSIGSGECVPANSSSTAELLSPAIRKWWHQEEQYRLTVILLMFLLNSSLSLLSYRTRSSLIAILLVTHLARMLWFRSIYKPCDRSRPSEIRLDFLQLTASLGDALMAALMLWSLAFARQLEYTNRTNFLWRNRLNVDHEELEYISGINKVLLENILPSHVVQHYLTHPNEQPSQQKSQLMPSLSAYMRMSFSNMSSPNNDLYHEQHESVAVMFASIPHFYEFYDESDISKQGLGCIALLNEIICDFDKLLLKNKFSRIEKIKTIGSSYMAAAGLRSNSLSGARNSNASQCSASSSIPPTGGSTVKRAPSTSRNQAQAAQSVSSCPGLSQASGCNLDQLTADDRRLVVSQQKLNLICMIKFATSLMTALNGINKQSFQVFKLRIGVNTGPVIAGIIGAQRPFYDIWGDCVNIASRMESLGEVGRIQVEERTAKLLMESLCLDTYSIVCRGPIEVKGKGGMVTYFVDKKETPLAGEDLGNQPHYQMNQKQADPPDNVAATVTREEMDLHRLSEGESSPKAGESSFSLPATKPLLTTLRESDDGDITSPDT